MTPQYIFMCVCFFFNRMKLFFMNCVQWLYTFLVEYSQRTRQIVVTVRVRPHNMLWYERMSDLKTVWLGIKAYNVGITVRNEHWKIIVIFKKFCCCLETKCANVCLGEIICIKCEWDCQYTLHCVQLVKWQLLI